MSPINSLIPRAHQTFMIMYDRREASTSREVTTAGEADHALLALS